ncbi:MAG: hypothetical protein Kow0069_03720 [Promethearchaeota archaeon]
MSPPRAKVSAITDEFSNEFDEVVEYLAGRGVDHVELRKVWAVDVAYLMDDMCADAKDVLDQFGVRVSCISGSLLKCVPPGSPEEKPGEQAPSRNLEYNLSLADRYVELAEFFGAPYLRCFGFQRGGPGGPPEEETWQTWADSVRAVLEKLRGKPVTLVCENEAGCTIRDLPSIQMAFGLVRDPQFKLLLDPANLRHAGQVLDDGTFEALRDLVGYVHAKDGRADQATGKVVTTVVGEGDSDLPKHFRALLDDGYDSFFSVETHLGGKGEEKWNNSVRALDALLDVLRGLGAWD